MKLTATTLLALAGMSVVQAQNNLVCPTATRTMQNRNCRKECSFSDCNFTSTVRNPCGCPQAVPTATLIAPCEADCPYQGCGIEFRTSALACPTTSTRRTPTSRQPTPTTRRTSLPIVTGITTLPPISRTTPCPTITRTTSPADCPAIRCPVPTCQVRTTLNIPCACSPRTMLYVQGCASECPGGCLTRVETVSANNC